MPTIKFNGFSNGDGSVAMEHSYSSDKLPTPVHPGESVDVDDETAAYLVKTFKAAGLRKGPAFEIAKK